jgi:hypothetical protein
VQKCKEEETYIYEMKKKKTIPVSQEAKWLSGFNL